MVEGGRMSRRKGEAATEWSMLASTGLHMRKGRVVRVGHGPVCVCIYVCVCVCVLLVCVCV